MLNMASSWPPKEWPEAIREVILICMSFALFRFLQFAVRWYLFGKCTFKTFSFFRRRKYHGRPVPDNRSLEVIPPNKKWRISNEVVSLIHSVVSGLWALYACISLPQLMIDMDHFQHAVPKHLVYLSFGYIIHDLIDLLVNERSLRIIELLFHHVVVTVAFVVTLVSHRFMGILMVGLLMELNSVFLHSRSLLNLYGQKKKSTAFRFIALLNVVTFFVFRIILSCYLFYWWFTNTFGIVPWYLAMVTFFIAASLTSTNVVLFYRVLAADGLLGTKRSRPTPHVHTHSHSHSHGHAHAHPPAVASPNQSTTNLEEVAPGEDDDDEECSTLDSSSSSSSSDEDGGDTEKVDLEAGPQKKKSSKKSQKSKENSQRAPAGTSSTIAEHV